MTCLDHDTLDEAYLIAAEIAVMHPQRAAQLLGSFCAAHRHPNDPEAERRASAAFGALLDSWEFHLEGPRCDD